MTEKINKLMTESAGLRWTALVLVALTMFCAYFFVDLLSPLQQMLEVSMKWDPESYGFFSSSEYLLNVYAFFLIFSGIILDKMGIRFTALTAGCIMLGGGLIKLYALTDTFNHGGFGFDFFNSFFTGMPPSVKLASIGFAIFGVGVEMAGITVSKAIVKWFKGKEMALAMGMEMATARLGVFAVFRLSPRIAENYGGVLSSVTFGVALLCIGLLTFIIYSFMDYKLDKQIGAQGNGEPEEEFKISDLKFIFTNRGFLYIAGLCVLFYSAIFPFQKYAANMLQNKLSIPVQEAADMVSWFPIGAMILTPILGYFLDAKGKGASMMLWGALLLICSHLIFALVPSEAFSATIAILSIAVLGIAFSLVPASMWPSVPKIVEERYLGSAYACIFWIQNIGLWLFPILIGWVLNISNPGVADAMAAGDTSVRYNYTNPMLVFAALGIAAVFLGILLKSEDKRKAYGLEKPNKA